MPAETPRAPGRAPSPNLRPPWRKGQSGNPRGRKRGESTAATLRKLLAEADVPDPKVFLLTVMHDKRRSMKLRVEAAKAVIGYMHPRLNATDIGLGNIAQGEKRVERFTLTIFDKHNGHRQHMLPPPDGDETQEGSDNDPL